MDALVAAAAAMPTAQVATPSPAGRRRGRGAGSSGPAAKRRGVGRDRVTGSTPGSASTGASPGRSASSTPAKRGRGAGSRYDSSLTLLTKRFTEMITSSPDGIVDLNDAAVKLNVQKRRIYDITNVMEGIKLIVKKNKNHIQWKGVGSGTNQDAQRQIQRLRANVDKLRAQEALLDLKIERQQAVLDKLGDKKTAGELLFVTHDDVRELEEFVDSTVIAIKAPEGTTLEVPDPDEGLDDGYRRFQIWIGSESGPIDVFLVSKLDDVGGTDVPFPPAKSNLPIGSEEFHELVGAPLAEPEPPAGAIFTPTKVRPSGSRGPYKIQPDHQQSMDDLPSHSTQGGVGIGDLFGQPVEPKAGPMDIREEKHRDRAPSLS